MRDTTLYDILQQAPIAVIILDETGRIKSLNEPAEHLFGYDRQELINQELSSIVKHDFKDMLASYSMHGLDHASSGTNFKSIARKKNGTEFSVYLTIGHSSTHENRELLAFVQDLTPEEYLSAKFSKIF